MTWNVSWTLLIRWAIRDEWCFTNGFRQECETLFERMNRVLERQDYEEGTNS